MQEVIARMTRWQVVMSAALIAACWPAGRWYIQRISDGSDEPWGLLALATLLVLRWRAGKPETASDERVFILPGALLALLTVAGNFVPPMVRAGICAIALGSVWLRLPRSAGLWGLLALSLPIVATAQFFLGYPLRVLTAMFASVALQLAGFLVHRQGVLLHWNGEAVMVDVPCSGLHMLWFGLYLALTLAAGLRLSWPRTLAALSLALGVIVAFNAIRATLLFIKEAGIVLLPEWTHEGVGLLCFAAGAWMILSLTMRLQPSSGKPARKVEAPMSTDTPNAAGVQPKSSLPAV